MPTVQFLRTHPDAVIPSYAEPGALGFDITCIGHDPVGKHDLVITYRTGLKMQFDEEGYGLYLFPRSSTFVKYGLSLSNGVGVIDPSYRGELLIKMARRHAGDPYPHEPVKLVQGVVLPRVTARIGEVSALTMTGRGEGGFGSTGN